MKPPHYPNIEPYGIEMMVKNKKKELDSKKSFKDRNINFYDES
jgi:hypothetical protein